MSRQQLQKTASNAMETMIVPIELNKYRGARQEGILESVLNNRKYNYNNRQM